MFGELIILGKIILSTALVVGLITVVNFLKTIYTTMVIPFIEMILPILKTSLELVLEFIKTEIPKTLQYLKNAIGYIKSKLSGIVTNYTKISRNDIQVQQKIYIIDNNDNLRCISVSGVIDESTLPDEIRLNINKEYHHELDLINIAINKLKATGNAYV